MCACGSGDVPGDDLIVKKRGESRYFRFPRKSPPQNALQANHKFAVRLPKLAESHAGSRHHEAKSAALFSLGRAPHPWVLGMASPDEAASGAEPFDVRELQGRIDAVLEREHACWGVLVYSTGLGRDIAAHRPDTALVPASNVKLFTALASLLVSHVGPTRALRTAHDRRQTMIADRQLCTRASGGGRAIVAHAAAGR